MNTLAQLQEAIKTFNTINLKQPNTTTLTEAYITANNIGKAYLSLKEAGPISFDLQSDVHEVMAVICDAPITSIDQLKDYELAALNAPHNYRSQLPQLAHRILWGDAINLRENKLPDEVFNLLIDTYTTYENWQRDPR